MSVRHSNEQTPAVIVHTMHVSIVKKIAKDSQSGILMPFDVEKRKSTLAAYGIANIFPHKKTNSTIIYILPLKSNVL